MAVPTTSTGRTGRPRKASTAATHPLALSGGTPTIETSTPSALGIGMSMPAPSYTSNGPMNAADCDAMAAQLLDPAYPLRKKLEIASDLRDSAEGNKDFAFYDKYLAAFIPALMTILGDERSITFMKDSIEQRYRHTLLSFLQRLPHTEPFRQHETVVMDMMVKLLKLENEENALLCIKIMIDGFRSHKEQTEPHVEPFLELVKTMYANTKQVVEKEFGSATAPKAAAAPTSAAPAPSPAPATPSSDNSALPNPPQASSSAHVQLPHALHSPKVLTECPIAVVLIFQTYKSVMAPAMLDFYPLVMESIKIQPEPQRVAHLEAKARGELFVGVASEIGNREMYTELIKAQVKTMAFLAYVLRGSQTDVKDYLQVFPEACVRLLRDCPPEDVGTRKELLVATRHILTVDSRSSFIPYIDTLLDERALVGTGVSSREALRPLAYSVVADLIHHVRNELPISQLARVVYVFSCNLNDATFSSSIQTMCAKLLNTIIESIHNKGDSAEATRIMRGMFVSSLEKLVAMTEAHDRIKALSTRGSGKGKEKEVVEEEGDAVMEDAAAEEYADRQQHGWKEIETARPVHSVAYANESLETFCREARYLFKTLLHTFRTLITYTRSGDNPPPQPDGELLSKFFQYTLRCLAVFDGNNRDPREPKEAVDLVSQILLLFDPHAFAEVWTTNMDFFIEHAHININIIAVLQALIVNELVSHQLVGILLKHLMKGLPEVGHQTKAETTLTLRLYKMSFLAINTFIVTNEMVLVPHLQKLIMDSFSFAAKAPDAGIYYQILRALFRSIGGGRFEALYKEVLPILQEMLDNLQYRLQHAVDAAQRDLFVELTLTVPVRLTNLLPHLSYLMKPLVHALKAGPDLISQGLRTLELCIDNLTSDFLDPTMGPVLRDLMSALHQLLKPVPSNRSHAHAAVKILGKLGGRNRRFQEVENLLAYKTPDAEISTIISFEEKVHQLPLSPLVEVSGKAIGNEIEMYREDGLQVLMLSALVVFQEDGANPEGNITFQKTMSGIFHACHQPSIKEKALEFVRDFCRRAFAIELNRNDNHEPAPKFSPDVNRKRFLPLTTALADAFVATLSEASLEDREPLGELLVTIVTDFRTMATGPEFTGRIDGGRSFDRMIHQFSHRFIALCHEEDWSKKMAGVAAMNLFVSKIGLSRKMIIDLEIDFVKALFFILRDAPKDAPSTVDEVTGLLSHLIKTCQSEDDGQARLPRLTEILVVELYSQSALSRQTTRDCIALLAETTNQTVANLVSRTAKTRLLDANGGPIFSKPLRALTFPMQVGNIEAVTYLLDLRPPVPEVAEEFIRLLHEVLALADVDDASLVGKPATHKQEYWLKTLRVACLRLLKSTMACTEFFTNGKMQAIRSRIIAVYFKHVYSASPEIVDVAHEGLRNVLEHQNKLPKEVLQSGLRPILVNLADAKRLSVSGLEGLARFLELLTNYFKVEIGVKLLDHFETLADAQMLAKAASSPLEDNPDIARMTRLVNIFRLLPPTAIQYLKPLTTHVVDVEALLHQSAPGPFTENLGKYLDRYHVEAATNLMENIRNPRFIWTYRNIIQSGHAPQLVEELSSRAEALCQLCFVNPDAIEFVLPGLYIIRELSKTSEGWLSHPDRESVLEALVGVWRSIVHKSRHTKTDMSSVTYSQIPSLLLEMFMASLKQKQHIQLLFHVVEAYEIRSSFERSYVSFFLYQQVALQDSVEYRRDVIEQFFGLYDEENVTWAFKTNALRLIVNPTVRTYFADSTNDGSMISLALIHKIAALMWKPLAATTAARLREDVLLIEVFGLTTLLVANCSTKVSDARKDLFKLGWMGINLLEPTVKLMAYLLTATFMKNFETPLKFVRLTWTGLLRLKDNESRALYRQAIDILASCISVRDPPGPSAVPDWAQRVKSVLIEEGHQTGQLVTVCELLVNHPDLFYDYRELYVVHVTNALPKLGFVQAATPEMKKLTVDIVELIFKWEKRRMAAKDAEAMDVDDAGRRTERGSDMSPFKRQRLDRAGTAASTSSGGGWAAPGQVRELMTAHLLRMVSTSSDPLIRGGLIKRALDLFKEMLGPKGLPNVLVKLAYFSRTMTQDINESTIATVANSSEVVAAVAEVRDQQWVKTNLGALWKLLEKVWLFDDTALHEVVRPLTERMFAELPEEDATNDDSEGQKLLAWLQTSVTDGLAASLRSSSNLPGTLFILKHWLKVQPQQLQNEAISSGLLKVLANLVKVHTTNGPDPTYRLIISILDIVRDRVSDLKEQRRALQSILGTLIERSTNLVLCRYLLDLLRQWVATDADGPFQGKEKSALLLRMAVFEQRDDALFQQYLDLVYEIYELDTLRGTDVTHRLEPAFLLGTRSKDPTQRGRFLDKLETSLPRSLDGRLQYLYSLSNWETLADSYWIPQLLTLLLGAADFQDLLTRQPLGQILSSDPLKITAETATLGELLRPARNLIHLDPVLCHRLWVSVFPICWSCLSRPQQTAFSPFVIKLLSKEYHRKQVDMRPNVIQTFLEGILPCTPVITLPPLLIKFLAKTYNAWYAGFEILSTLNELYRSDDVLRDTAASALSELYADLGEEDMYYGLARGRCVFPETTAGLTYEQNGQWPKAIEMYEQAQLKARQGLLPFSEDEYCLWEDHWILAAQKLQHWDSLTDLARTDQDSDLLLECAWRLSDWGSSDREMIETNLARVSDVATPRRKVFEAFTALIKAHNSREPPNDFLRILDEAQQIAIRKWTSLPNQITGAHLPLLQLFQQCVELNEASSVFDSLQMTNQSNLEVRVNSDLKQIFQTWRDRLPNFWDDISVWSDLLAWRQHVFTAVTKVYVPLIPQGETGTFGYRGYHETAWMINRFGEVARRHGLLDVCSVALNKIYSLPNIEISEAFLKLREQALCFFQKPDKFNDGLENISTTNLMYFAPPQKAEFLTLKGMFISRLGQNEDANAEFAHAIQMDMNLPKAWAEWGRFNDKLYRERPEYIPGVPEPEPGKPKLTEAQWSAQYAQDRAILASSAVSCYLQAAGLYNNHKSRALLLRVLWLLGLDDAMNTVAKAFENYKGDLVVWYWITLIPQLLLSLSHREAKQARLLLMRIAKGFPQRQHMLNSRNERAAAARKTAEASKPSGLSSEVGASPQEEKKDVKDEPASATSSQPPATPASTSMPPPPPAVTAPPAPRQPWELVDEIMNILKTAFPLLALSMEKMCDQISYRAKPNPEEDIYRFFAALLNDAMQQWSGRSGLPNDDGELSSATKDNLNKFANNLNGELKAAIENDFMKDMPKLREYIKRLQRWRDLYEKSLDARPRSQGLDVPGCNLIDFHHSKFDDVEIPGQYVQHVDQTDEFVKIARFSPKAELGRGHGFCFRRLAMIGSNGSIHSFSVQLPAARHCRREERLTQLFRIMNSVLRKRKESRRRNLQFHLPTAVALAPQLRLVQNDSSYVSMQDIYDDFSSAAGMSREDTILAFYDRVKELHDPAVPRVSRMLENVANEQTDQKFIQLKAEVMEEIQTKMVPETVLTNYMIKTMSDAESLWLMRKQFALQTATVMFLTYTCCLSNRTPGRFHLSRKTGLMYMTEILPSFAPGQPVITSTEAVPFRLTPNMQHFITRVGIEGVVTASATALSKSLTMPEFDLGGTLSLFIRDEILTWQNTYMKDPRAEAPLTASVYKNVDNFIRRAGLMGYVAETKDKGPNAAPMVHAIVTLIGQATAPNLLAQMNETFMAWF
ncbi:transformation/transcription domain-associated protein, partial [Tremellales sp. Uapishka_1]